MPKYADFIRLATLPVLAQAAFTATVQATHAILPIVAESSRQLNQISKATRDLQSRMHAVHGFSFLSIKIAASIYFTI